MIKLISVSVIFTLLLPVILAGFLCRLIRVGWEIGIDLTQNLAKWMEKK